MTKKEFRFLEQLEDDLRDAAARERVASEGRQSRRRESHSSGGGEHQWTRWIAAAVVVLVVAGGVGAFVQHQTTTRDSVSAGPNLVHGSAIGSAGSTGEKLDQQTNQSAPHSYGGVYQPGSAPAPSASLAPDLARTAVNGTGQSLNGDAFAQVNDSLGVSKGTLAVSPGVPPASEDISKVIRTGVITVELPTGGFAKARDQLSTFAANVQGYVLSSTARGGVSGSFVLRIPAKSLDSVMGEIANLPGGKVLWQNSKGQDVTAQFVDSQAQLQILDAEKTVTLRYLKNAGSLSQSIQFRDQAFQIQGQIDKLVGQLKYLKNQVALATLTVNLRETGAPATHKAPPVTKPSLVRAWDRAVSGFLGVLSAVIVGLGFVIPLGALALLIWFLVTVLRRKRRAANLAS